MAPRCCFCFCFRFCFLLLLLLPPFLLPASAIGFNWGYITHHPVPAPAVVQLLLANNIPKVKLFDAIPSALHALAGSGIEVMVGIPNELLRSFASSPAAADAWVQFNLTAYMGKRGSNIKYVTVGNEPFLAAYGTQFQNDTYYAMKHIYESIVKVGLSNQVKVTIPFNADVFLNSVPSKGQFRPDVKESVRQIVALLDQTNSPFIVNIYPFLDLTQQSTFPQDFAFFDGTSHPLVDGSFTYSNVLDASLDLAITALSSIGYPSVQVVIGEIGWPTEGGVYANVSTAQRFNQGLINHISSKQGTPLRPGTTIEAYLFSLFDENEKSVLPGNFERHWGVFTFDGQAKYPLDLTGQGRKTNTLVNADNIPYLPTRWCVANPSANESHLSMNAQYACANSDCTALSDGGSCSNIGAPTNFSYAFNTYYQQNNQEASSCNFDGLGIITFVDPSVGDCRFLIAVSDAGLIRSSLSIYSLLLVMRAVVYFAAVH